MQDARLAAEKGCFGYCVGCQGRRIHHEIASQGRDRDVAAQEDDAHGRMASLKVTRRRARACIRCWHQSAKESGETDCSQRRQRTAAVAELARIGYNKLGGGNEYEQWTESKSEVKGCHTPPSNPEQQHCQISGGCAPCTTKLGAEDKAWVAAARPSASGRSVLELCGAGRASASASRWRAGDGRNDSVEIQIQTTGCKAPWRGYKKMATSVEPP
ncbi:hypothetical protein B0H13DRAFT_1929287 [Mycena leptocephala]|nr:hypothetical protein B0H13DRAFT_1929287 [Mycena leptocephala]